jgi:hypothetical protein
MYTQRRNCVTKSVPKMRIKDLDLQGCNDRLLHFQKFNHPRRLYASPHCTG